LFLVYSSFKNYILFFAVKDLLRVFGGG
jgi:hypothetical protein